MPPKRINFHRATNSNVKLNVRYSKVGSTPTRRAALPEPDRAELGRVSDGRPARTRHVLSDSADAVFGQLLDRGEH